MTDIKLVPLTQSLAESFYGARPMKTIQGIAAVRGNQVLGLAGFYRNDTKIIVFTELNEEIRKDRRTLVKGIRLIRRMIKNYRFPVYSYADPCIQNADILLLHVGFTHYDNGVYQWRC
jgi:hypothetical protein